MSPRKRKVIERLIYTVEDMIIDGVTEENIEFRSNYFAPQDVESGIAIFMGSQFAVDNAVLEVSNQGEGYYKIVIAEGD